MHAYVHGPGGRTAYLSELASGSDVVVADANGAQRSAVVGRVKIETRPLVSDECARSCGLERLVLEFGALLKAADAVRATLEWLS